MVLTSALKICGDSSLTCRFRYLAFAFGVVGPSGRFLHLPRRTHADHGARDQSVLKGVPVFFGL